MEVPAQNSEGLQKVLIFMLTLHQNKRTATGIRS